MTQESSKSIEDKATVTLQPRPEDETDESGTAVLLIVIKYKSSKVK